MKGEYNPKTAFGNTKLIEELKEPLKRSGTFTNTCCCCGKEFEAHWKGLSAKSLAEVADVCPDCFKADCRVMFGDRCKVTGKKQYRFDKD